MGKTDLDIVFDNAYGVFKAGQILSGKLALNLQESKKCEGLTIRFKGKAKTSWTKNRGKTSTHYGDEEVYFDDVVHTKFESNFSEKIIPSGFHEIPFIFTLKTDLPSSYEGPYGHIRYLCTATFVRTWKFDLMRKRPFTLIAMEDLNSIAGVDSPICMKESQELFCCCFRRGMVSLTFTLSKKGYVPGERLVALCQVDNHSKSPIRHVMAVLKQHVTFKGRTLILNYTGSKEISQEVTQLCQATSIAPGTCETLRLNFVVPPVPPRLVGCHLIDVDYVLKFKIGAYIRCRVPIVIGTVPLRSTNSTGAAAIDVNLVIDRATPHSPNAEGIAAAANSDRRSIPFIDDSTKRDAKNFQNFCETPPPTYRECVFGGRGGPKKTVLAESWSSGEEAENFNGQHITSDSTNHQRPFVPRYVYYNLA